MRQPRRALDHAVEEVAVGDPQPALVGGDVNAVLRDLDAAEGMVDVAACELVVVARNEDDPRALARLAQQLLDHVVVGARPIPRAPQLPAVDDVADEVQRLALRMTQEIEQRCGAAPRRAQVQVGDPQRAHAQHGGAVEDRIGKVALHDASHAGLRKRRDGDSAVRSR